MSAPEVLEGRLDVFLGPDDSCWMELVPSWPTTAGPPPAPLAVLDKLAEFEGHHIKITVEVLR